MIISHKYKFIFIKTRKTAGTSIEYNLSEYLGKNDVITPSSEARYLAQNYYFETKISNFFKFLNLKNLSNFFKKKINDHIHADELKNIIDRNIYNNYFKFCVEREPVDKCISYYFMRKNSSTSSIDKKKMTWEQFVKKKRFPVDTNLYIEDDILLVDKIIKYENLEQELYSILSKLGLNNFRIENSKNNSTREKEPLVTHEHKKIIYEKFRSSLKYTNYKFDISNF